MIPEAEHKSHPQDPFLGAVVEGRYRLIGLLLPLERGAVYRAVEDPVGQEVALRIFVHGIKDEAKESERFRKEAEGLARLRNPGVVSLLAYGTGQAIHWAAYEMVRAEALAQGLQRGPLAWSQALGLTQHLLAGLDAAHRIGFLHGELTPANVLVIQEQAGLRARLAGLGSNRLFGIDLIGNLTRPAEGAALRPTGLVEYLSPEQIEGRHQGPWSDIYSLGCVLFHMLAGRPPVGGSDARAALQAHLQGQLARLEPAYACPREVIELVGRALSRAPAHRFPDARSMYEAISAIISNPQRQMVAGGSAAQGGRVATPPATRPPTGEVASRPVPRPGGEAEQPKAVTPPATRIMERLGDSVPPRAAEAAERVRQATPAARPAATDGDAGRTMDIDLDEVQEMQAEPDTGQAERPHLQEEGGPRQAGGTMDIDADDLQEIEGSEPHPKPMLEPTFAARSAASLQSGSPQQPFAAGAASGGQAPFVPGPASGGQSVFAAAPTGAGQAAFAPSGPRSSTPAFSPAVAGVGPATSGQAAFAGAPAATSRSREELAASPQPQPYAAAQPSTAPGPGPLKPAPDGAPGVTDPEKATVLVDVDDLELARLQQEYGRSVAHEGTGGKRRRRGDLPLPLPALIGVGALAAALLVVFIVAGLSWLRPQDEPAVVPAAGTGQSKALALLTTLGESESVVSEEDTEPAEGPDETLPQDKDELRKVAEERIKEIAQREAEIAQKMGNMIQRARALIGQVPPNDRPQAHRLARELLGLAGTRRGLAGEIAQLRAGLRRADEEKLKGIAANAYNLRSNLMEVLGYSQSAYDELQDLANPPTPPRTTDGSAAVATVETAPRASMPTAVATAETAPRASIPVAPPPAEVPATASTPARAPATTTVARLDSATPPARSDAVMILPSSSPRPERQPADPELSALIASVRQPASEPQRNPPAPATIAVQPASTPAMVERAPASTGPSAAPPSMLGAAGPTGSDVPFAPVTSSPARPPAGKGIVSKDLSSESDEDLLLRILGSPREGPILVSGESCPCNPASIEQAARSGGRGLTECELRACEKVPPGTHHFSEINLNLASYFFKQRNLRREFEALYRATSYGSYKHDPQVLAAYIKVAVGLKRFQIALQAKDRFLFVQDKLPPDQRRPKVAEVYKVLAQAFEHQFYRQKELKPKSTDYTYLNRAIDFWERYADYSGQRGRAEETIAELKKLRSELEHE